MIRPRKPANKIQGHPCTSPYIVALEIVEKCRKRQLQFLGNSGAWVYFSLMVKGPDSQKKQCLWSLAETPYFTDPGWLKGYACPNSDLFLSSLHPPDVRPSTCLLIQARPWHQPKRHEGFAAPGRAWGTRPKVQEVEKFWSALGWTQPGWAIIWIIIQFSEGKLNRE